MAKKENDVISSGCIRVVAAAVELILFFHLFFSDDGNYATMNLTLSDGEHDSARKFFQHNNDT